MHHAVRTLWTASGLCTVAVGAVGDVSWESRLLVILSGIVTLLLSILFGGFVKHLAEHQGYTQTLEQQLSTKAARLFEVLERTQTKEACDMIQRFNATQLAELNRKVDALLQREHRESA